MSAVAAASLVLVAGAATVLARGSRSQRPGAEVPNAARDSTATVALFAAVRGSSPIACSLIGNALENRWGRATLGGPDVSVLDSTQASVRAWATSNQTIDDVLPLARRAMEDPDVCVRRTAAALVGRTRSANIAGLLAAEMSSGSAETREAATLALGYAGQPASVAALVARSSDDAVAVRRLVAWALGRTDNRAAGKPLIAMLGDGDALVRVNAALALGSLEAKDAIPALTKTLASDADPRARRAAAAALGQMN